MYLGLSLARSAHPNHTNLTLSGLLTTSITDFPGGDTIPRPKIGVVATGRVAERVRPNQEPEDF
jgi:hypothetical protein